ncbi:histone lysine methyltransferase Set9 [Marasmius crinis-equi]|uniref:Histone lysine methyltransferase Set9 n=1 Tax=Marasmius crinis-equi TaxID=585013 RepID=A0ABR3FPD6_9AGAR
MAPAVSFSSASKGAVAWRPTKIMNMRDLSKDDDFLSHLLVEKLGTGNVPLLVHKMDSSRRLPKVSASDLLDIVRRLVFAKGPLQVVIRVAVDDLLRLPPIRYYLQTYTQKQINAFATHASRYFELYQPGGSIEISHTSRYSHRTGKSELCILATKILLPGSVITELKGSMANLTDEEDRELKRTGLENSDIRRDFSVIHSKSMKKNHLFLGPARFVNHDCDNNCELFREGRYITFRVIKPIAIGEEITAHYGDGYFGKKNRHCLCETCEKRGRGGYAPDHEDNEPDISDSSTDSSDESDDDLSDIEELSGGGGAASKPNLDERRTRRGVYAIVNKEEDASDESDNEDENVLPLAGAPDIPAAVEIELAAEVGSELTSLSSSIPPSEPTASTSSSVLTPVSRSTSSLSSLSSAPSAAEDNNPSPSASKSKPPTPFRSVISTRRQKAQQAAASLSAASSRNASLSLTPSSHTTRSICAPVSPLKGKGKGRAVETPSRSSVSISTPTRSAKGKEKEAPVKIKKEEVETRVLRARPSFPLMNQEDPKDLPSRPVAEDTPKLGPDGKPLPLCKTCKNVLPVISVDSKVVWGLGMEKKKKLKQDCPRCMRHMAIYGQSWPRRVPLPGSASTFVLTPREDSAPVETLRRVTQNALPTLDRKLAAVVSSKRKHDSSASVDEPQPAPPKRPRISLSLSPSKSQQELPASASISDAPPKRKRGRPRKHPLPGSVSAPVVPMVKTEEEEISLHPFKDQSRKANGQFGVKASSVAPRGGATPSTSASSPARSREQRALEREKKREKLDGKKRAVEGESEASPSKRGRWAQEPMQKMFPKPSPFRSLSGGLFSRPNPIRFATQAWAGPLVTSEEEEKEKEKGPSAVAAAEDVLGAMPSLTYKPTPFNFARRRWNSSSLSTERESSSEDLESLPTPSSSELNTPTSPASTTDSLLETNQFFTGVSASVGAKSKLVTVSSRNWDEMYEMGPGDEDTLHFIPPPISPPSFVKSTAGKDHIEASLDVARLREVYAAKEGMTRVCTRFASQTFGPPPNFVNAGWEI